MNLFEIDDSGAMAHVVETGGDAELIRLGALLDATWRQQAAAEAAGADIEEPYERAHGLVAEIEQRSATTLAGLLVKARACSWCHGGEPFDLDFFDEHPTTDARLAASVFRDLLAIGGVQMPAS